jgi:carboxyl-terminal processing protease
MIDDAPARDLSSFAGTRRLRGTPGSKVNLVVFRSSAADPHNITLVREAIKGEGVSARRLQGGEAYVRVPGFNAQTAADLRKQIASLGQAANSGIVIDLRGTADGVPADGALAARLFLKPGATAATRATRTEPAAVTKAETGDGALTMPVVLLVSNGTSHAAEVFAAALADNDRADLVGEPTAGLAAEQRLVRLPQGYGLWMTFARYLRSDGKKPIHGEGLEPDLVTDPQVVEFGEAPPPGDTALDKAAERLKTKR